MSTPASIRADLPSDLVYLHHPSARHDLPSPLALHPASWVYSPVFVDNYYITGAHSSNSLNEDNYDVYRTTTIRA
jgi:hypothetical protein